LEELRDLAHTGGAQVIGSLTQKLKRPTQSYLGEGKLQEIKSLIKEKGADTVICDDELAPTQQRNLEAAFDDKIKVIDRTALILHIFAQSARTHEGRLQVELAQHEYLMPRLAGQWSHLERLAGGIGTRGPGETQIETDRRLVRGRIQRLKKEIENVRQARGRHRSRRRDTGIPVASLVGYTNAGKSTLLNAITRSTVTAEDKLFSTLDPVVRKVRLPSGRDMLLSDTVGFIQKLPPTIIASFRATLEEIEEAAMLIHVVDVGHSKHQIHQKEVDSILRSLHLDEKPRILVFNKVDTVKKETGDLESALMLDSFATRPATVYTSATTGVGLPDLLEELDARIPIHN